MDTGSALLATAAAHQLPELGLRRPPSLPGYARDDPDRIDLPTQTIEIRLAHAAATPALMQLGQLDSTPVPPAPRLLAFEGGELRAAMSLATRAAIGDPFAPTARLVELMGANGDTC